MNNGIKIQMILIKIQSNVSNCSNMFSYAHTNSCNAFARRTSALSRYKDHSGTKIQMILIKIQSNVSNCSNMFSYAHTNSCNAFARRTSALSRYKDHSGTTILSLNVGKVMDVDRAVAEK